MKRNTLNSLTCAHFQYLLSMEPNPCHFQATIPGHDHSLTAELERQDLDFPRERRGLQSLGTYRVSIGTSSRTPASPEAQTSSRPSTLCRPVNTKKFSYKNYCHFVSSLTIYF